MNSASGLALLDSDPRAAGLILKKNGAVLASRDWQGTKIDAPVREPALWPAGFDLSIGLEIPDQGAGAKRPYVVVWVTDEARQPVRTLLVLGPEARWRESNYIYWRRIERMDADKVAGIARPTRAPGRYDVIWDGRDENGAPVPPGTYSIHIEISREHGGHNYITRPLVLGQQPLSDRIEPSQELGEVAIRYGRRT
jgi:thiamine biosynthesis lipoprotein